jgi:hypothetical protein
MHRYSTGQESSAAARSISRDALGCGVVQHLPWRARVPARLDCGRSEGRRIPRCRCTDISMARNRLQLHALLAATPWGAGWFNAHGSHGRNSVLARPSDRPDSCLEVRDRKCGSPPRFLRSTNARTTLLSTRAKKSTKLYLSNRCVRSYRLSFTLRGIVCCQPFRGAKCDLTSGRRPFYVRQGDHHRTSKVKACRGMASTRMLCREQTARPGRRKCRKAENIKAQSGMRPV